MTLVISPFLSSLKALLRSGFSITDGNLAQTCMKMELDIHFQKWQEQLKWWCDDTRRNHWQLIQLVRRNALFYYVFITDVDWSGFRKTWTFVNWKPSKGCSWWIMWLWQVVRNDHVFLTWRTCFKTLLRSSWNEDNFSLRSDQPTPLCFLLKASRSAAASVCRTTKYL